MEPICRYSPQEWDSSMRVAIRNSFAAIYTIAESENKKEKANELTTVFFRYVFEGNKNNLLLNKMKSADSTLHKLGWVSWSEKLEKLEDLYNTPPVEGDSANNAQQEQIEKYQKQMKAYFTLIQEQFGYTIQEKEKNNESIEIRFSGVTISGLQVENGSSFSIATGNARIN
jgi:hypothetical protein